MRSFNNFLTVIQPVLTNKIIDDGKYQIEKNRRHFKEKFCIEEQDFKPQKRLFSALNLKTKIKKKD